ncbi:MAG: UMP kinase, partial [Deltaproteobacteria bacterium]
MSGEALMGDRSFGLDAGVVERVAAEIKTVHDLGVETGIVIGGGNIFRGLQGEALGIGRVSGDHMGMLATIINAIALGEALRRIGSDARVMTAIDMIK